jgi:protein gp37
MAKTSIEWAERSWNFLAGCTHASPGCTNCYAQKQASRIERMAPSLEHYQGLTKPSKAGPVWAGKIGFAEHKLLEPLSVKKPSMWFVNSMSDLFHDEVPDTVIDRAFAVMALAPHHTFQVLTKRSKRMREYFSNADLRSKRIAQAFLDLMIAGTITGYLRDENYPLKDGQPDDEPRLANFPLPNVWLGVSVEDQKRADERIPDLLATPAAVRWISAEPLLGPVDLTAIELGDHQIGDALSGVIKWGDGTYRDDGTPHLNWVVVGGESGPGARVWAGFDDACRSLRDQCKAASVSFFMKQMQGARKSFMPPIPDDLMIREYP